MADTLKDFAKDHEITLTAQSVAQRPDVAGGAWHKDSIHFLVTLTMPDRSPGFKPKRPPIVVWTGFYSVGSAHPLMWAKSGAKLRGSTKRDPRAKLAYQRLGNKQLPSGRLTLHDEKHLEEIKERFASVAPLDVADVLYSLQADSQGWDLTFEDWASDYGLDTDSIKARSVYDACQTIAKTIRKVFGPAEFDRFLSCEED